MTWAKNLAVGSALLVMVLLIDFLGPLGQLPLVVMGLLDETAHVGTTWLALRLLRRRWPGMAIWTAVAATVFIDVDHVPAQFFETQVLTAGTSRPYSHSALTVIVLLLLSAVARRSRWVLLGAALGVALHLFRDLATGPGVALLWPVSSDSVTLPYAPYTLSLAALVALPLLVEGVRRARGGQARFSHVRTTHDR